MEMAWAWSRLGIGRSKEQVKPPRVQFKSDLRSVAPVAPLAPLVRIRVHLITLFLI